MVNAENGSLAGTVAGRKTLRMKGRFLKMNERVTSFQGKRNTKKRRRKKEPREKY